MEFEAQPAAQSLVSWLYAGLGWKYAILLPLVGLVSFPLALIVVLRGKGPMAGAALILIVHTPLLVGIFAAMQGVIASGVVLANSTATLKPSELALGISLTLVSPLVGMLLMVPGYATAAFGAFIRSFPADSDSQRGR